MCNEEQIVIDVGCRDSGDLCRHDPSKTITVALGLLVLGLEEWHSNDQVMQQCTELVDGECVPQIRTGFD